jgi:hypothetical protein
MPKKRQRWLMSPPTPPVPETASPVVQEEEGSCVIYYENPCHIVVLSPLIATSENITSDCQASMMLSAFLPS